MAESQEEASLRLYEILEDVGLSEEMRLSHRKSVLGEIFLTVGRNLRPCKSHEIFYIFGSSCEGSTISEMKSDCDIVCCDTIQQVVTDVREAEVRESLLMVQDDYLSPGYVKVQRVLHGIPFTISEMDEDECYGPDIDGKMCFKNVSGQGKKVHGPAIDGSNRDVSEVPLDIVPALICVSVPDIVKLWLRRTRQYGWPPRQCMIKMATLPNFLVGVGHPSCVDVALQWRISYSLHERELMFSLNPTQHKCYGTMKMIKKDVINPAIGEESISSYHLKTCLFWAIEKTPADIWRPDQLLHCLNRCFWYLLYFVLTQNCPNYFRPDANLFEREVFVRLQKHLSSNIKDIIRLPHVVSRIKCADVGRKFDRRSTRIPIWVLDGIHCARWSTNISIINSISAVTKELVQFSYIQPTQEERVAKLYNLLHTWSCARHIKEHTKEQTDEARQFMLPCLHFRLATCLAAEGVNVNNGPMGQQCLLQLSILHLTQSSTRDLMGARLMYVTILYKLGRYHQCEEILRLLDRDLQPHVQSKCACAPEKIENDEFWNWTRENKPSARSMLISSIVACVTFLPNERELVPEPLQCELNRSRDSPHNIPSTDLAEHNRYNWACVDGKVYLHLMKYLVYSQEEKDTCRNDLLDVINNDPGLQHKDTAYNVLGWMYAQQRQYEDAFRYWKTSLKMQRDHNAACRHIHEHLGYAFVVNPNLNPKDISYNILGVIYSHDRRYSDALRCWRRSIEIQGDDNDASRHIRELLRSFP